MLHLINQATLTAALLVRIAAGDDLLLLQALVWAAHQGHEENDKLIGLMNRACGIHVLQAHLAVHGLLPEQLLPGVVVIDFPGLVDLTIKHPHNITWR